MLRPVSQAGVMMSDQDDARVFAANEIARFIRKRQPFIEDLAITVIDLPDSQGQIQVQAKGHPNVVVKFRMRTCCVTHLTQSMRESGQFTRVRLQKAGYLTDRRHEL